MIRAVAFDVGGVLEDLDDASWPAEWQRDWAARFGIDEHTWAESMSRFDQSGLETGAMTEAECKQGYRQGLGLTVDDVELMFADLWDRYCGSLNAELLQYARSLSEQYRLAIISNSGDGARREEERRYRFSAVFDPIIYSHEVGVAKPDERIWVLAYELIGVAPAELVFIDDGIGACRAAQAFGITAIHHSSTQRTIEALRSLLD
jgi:putative hydrolase of the HAD superfamily